MLKRRECSGFARVNKVTSASLGYPLSVFNKNSTVTLKEPAHKTNKRQLTSTVNATPLMTSTTDLGLSIRVSMLELRESGDWDIFFSRTFVYNFCQIGHEIFFSPKIGQGFWLHFWDLCTQKSPTTRQPQRVSSWNCTTICSVFLQGEVSRF